MEMTLQRDSGVSLYRQIIGQVRDRIEHGELPAGYRLPTVRKLAADLGVTRLTVHSAYSELQSLGLVESTVGRGTFVALDAARPGLPDGAARPPDAWPGEGVLAALLQSRSKGEILSFTQAFPAPETYPADELAALLKTLASDPDVLGYGDADGQPELREQMATLAQARGVHANADHVLITSGAQQGIDVALRALTEPGDVVLVEEPVYPGVLQLAAARRQRVVGVPNDGGRLRVAALDAACARYRPRLLYLVPTFCNPTGRSLSPESRSEVLRLASEYDLTVIEDDTYGDLGFDTAPPALKSQDAEDRIIYLTSFSKSLAPALRLGAVIAGESILPGMAAAKHGSDLVCSLLLQSATAEYVRRGSFAAHVEHVRALYRERRDAMTAALPQHLPECTWDEPEGGLSLWLALPPGVVERDIVADALREGVAVAPGSAFYPHLPHQAAMRLSFAAQPPDRIEHGVEALARVLRRHLTDVTSRSALRAGARCPLV